MELIKLIDNANLTLIKLYGTKHNKPITSDDIESVYPRNLLSIGVDSKTVKGEKFGYLTGILYLAPSKLSGVNLCVAASEGCIAACLFSAGRGRFYSVTRQRIVKTIAYLSDKPRFIESIKRSVAHLERKARRMGLNPVARLNGTSDIAWERTTDIVQSFPNVQFYDYTKIVARTRFDIPSNYHLTLSMSENNEKDALEALNRGVSVAVVFRDANFPSQFLGHNVTSGDGTDLRFLDERGVFVALKAKGKAKSDTSGFVKNTACA